MTLVTGRKMLTLLQRFIICYHDKFPYKDIHQKYAHLHVVFGGGGGVGVWGVVFNNIRMSNCK